MHKHLQGSTMNPENMVFNIYWVAAWSKSVVTNGITDASCSVV